MTNSQTLTNPFERLKPAIIAAVQTLEQSFTAPDEDWPPTLFLELASGQVQVAILDTLFLRDEKSKDRLAYHILPALILERQPRTVGVLFSGWLVQLKPGDLEEGASAPVRPSQDPRRVEVLTLSMYAVTPNRGVQAELNITDGVATITRDGIHPPTLGAWRFTPHDKTINSHGRFIDPVVASLLTLAGLQSAPLSPGLQA